MDRADAAAKKRIFLSPPDVGAEEQALVAEAFASNWIAPLGPHVDAFEAEFATQVGAKHGVALSSGTAALHLGLAHLGVGAGDEVVVSTLTFAASAMPVMYLGAKPVFVDSDNKSWNMDPALLADWLNRRAKLNRLPKVVIPVHLYGQTPDVQAIVDACARHGIPVLEDSTEALGADYRGKAAGTHGVAGTFSFNGNKMITTSGGGMLTTNDAVFAAHVRKMATQSREPAPHYEHAEIGYNYRLSNVLAAIGRAQLKKLERKVAARRHNFARYLELLGDLPGLAFMPEAEWGRHSRWLTTLTIDPAAAGTDREKVRLALEAQNIEARPVWKPMHMQPVFNGCEAVGGGTSQAIFENGLCLPSGSNLAAAELERVADVVRGVFGRSRAGSKTA